MRARNKHSANPKIWSVEMPNAPYLNRCMPCKKGNALKLISARDGNYKKNLEMII